uniref:NAD-dependent epimerase/dehydratase domain-containing protein n=1 Tax=Mycena chlorophos TaxID=658473 RepID=A0ABQ0LDZ8_MYCCL|nr:predicted protein [Mycena chlorophos]
MSTTTQAARNLVFVTGASGYLGSVVVHELLEAGYHVRGSARGQKVAQIQTAFARYGEQFKAVEIADIASSDFTNVLEGVSAIIHTAAPLPGRVDLETGLKTSVDGSLHILRAAQKAGIARVVVTGTIATFPKALTTFGTNDWVEVTKEDAAAPDTTPLTRYVAYKKYGEQAVMKYAAENPEMAITILNPTWIFGPFPPGYEAIVPTPQGAFQAFATNGFLYQLLRPDNKNYHYFPGCIDVRDVARIHIAALAAATNASGRRIAISSPYDTGFREAISFIHDERPELRGRLADPDSVPRWERYRLPEIDLDVVERDLGFSAGRFTTWRETVLDGVDRLIEIENMWNAKGYSFEVPAERPM